MLKKALGRPANPVTLGNDLFGPAQIAHQQHQGISALGTILVAQGYKLETVTLQLKPLADRTALQGPL